MSQKNDDFSAYVSKITNMQQDLHTALEFIDFRNIVRKDSVVFVKPNFTFPRYKEGVTTSPRLLSCLLKILKDRADRVIVGESDGGNKSFSAKEAFEGHDMLDIARDTGAELVNLSDLPRSTVEDNIQGKKVSVQLPNLLLNEVDCVVSVPVLKVHVITGVSLSMKNLWGCYPDTMRCLHHKHLDYKLGLMTKRLNPRMVVIDGTYSLDEHGPMYGTPRETNLILASNNAVVADALGSEIMAIPLKVASHILIAERENLGTTDLTRVRMNSGIDSYRLKFGIKKTLLDRVSVLLFNSEFLAKTVMDSGMTPIIYKAAGRLRTSREQSVALELERHY